MSEVSLHYSLNSQINAIAGNDPINVADTDRWLAACRSQMNFIKEEIDETVRAMEENDRIALRDGIADSIVTLDGLYYRLGLQYPDQTWLEDEVIRSSALTDAGMGSALSVAFKALQNASHTVSDRLESGDADALDWITLTARNLMGCLYCIAYLSEIPLQADQHAVYVSNLSKFDTDYAEAVEGLVRYMEQGVCATLVRSVVGGERYFIIRVLEDSTSTRGKYFPAGKFLKSKNFQEPVFDTKETVG